LLQRRGNGSFFREFYPAGLFFFFLVFGGSSVSTGRGRRVASKKCFRFMGLVKPPETHAVVPPNPARGLWFLALGILIPFFRCGVHSPLPLFFKPMFCKVLGLKNMFTEALIHVDVGVSQGATYSRASASRQISSLFCRLCEICDVLAIGRIY